MNGAQRTILGKGGKKTEGGARKKYLRRVPIGRILALGGKGRGGGVIR